MQSHLLLNLLRWTLSSPNVKGEERQSAFEAQREWVDVQLGLARYVFCTILVRFTTWFPLKITFRS